MKKELKCCFTGYRPNKFPFSLCESNEYRKFENLLFEKIAELAESGVTEFLSGMAMGFDIICAEIVLEIKKAVPDKAIKLTCALPYIEQSNSYPEDWKKRYDDILNEADEVVLVSDSYHKGCFLKRNKYMVDNSDLVLTFFDGKSGGTKNTVLYAEKKGRMVINLYE